MQMPVIPIGQLICCVATALLTAIGTTTPTVVWATFLVLVGIGLRRGVNTPYVAIQGVNGKVIPATFWSFHHS